MKKESNIIDTKENSVKNFRRELYPAKRNDKEMLLAEKEERAIKRLEKTCDILSVLLKVEIAITLVVVTFAFIFDGFSNTIPSQTKYQQASVSERVNEYTKI